MRTTTAEIAGRAAAMAPATIEPKEGGAIPSLLRALAGPFKGRSSAPSEGRKRASRCTCYRKEKELRGNLSERQIDTMVEDSFPASDPPSNY